jgi:hypothetical protein
MQTEKTLPSIKNNITIGFLPNYFKKIGIGMLILFFIPALIIKLLDVSFYTQNRIFFREISTSVFILGLFFIAWSKEKNENNEIQLLRYKAFAVSFFFAVFRVLLTPLTDLLFGESVGDTKPTDVILNMLFIYLFIFYITKKARPKETN